MSDPITWPMAAVMIAAVVAPLAFFAFVIWLDSKEDKP